MSIEKFILHRKNGFVEVNLRKKIKFYLKI